jgi:hypothetical protein
VREKHARIGSYSFPRSGVGTQFPDAPASEKRQPATDHLPTGTTAMRTILSCLVLLLAAPAFADEPKPNTLSPDEAKDGFTLLFNGKDLDGWHGDVKKYPVKDGVITCEGTNIFANKQYDNFVFRFEFLLPPAGNNGVGIRTPDSGDSAYAGMEIQILDDRHENYKNLHDYQAHGSIYGVVPAKRDALKPTGQWNTEEIVADGSKIKVTVNGTVIVDADLSTIKDTIDHNDHPGLHNPKGYIGFLGHGDPVKFRNIRVKELKK